MVEHIIISRNPTGKMNMDQDLDLGSDLDLCSGHCCGHSSLSISSAIPIPSLGSSLFPSHVFSISIQIKKLPEES